MKLWITFTPDQYRKIGFSAHCIALLLQLFFCGCCFFSTPQEPKEGQKWQLLQLPKSFLTTEGQTPQLWRRTCRKKLLFPPHGTKKSPCVTWAAFVSHFKAKFALLLPFKSLQMNCFCRAALPDTSFRTLGGEKPNVFLCRWMILGRNHLFSDHTEFPSSRAKPGVHCSTLGESMWIFFF